jgi:hypothetical protein
MRLYHDRESDRPGPLDARDEEECFTVSGRRVGVYLTTEVLSGPTTFAADVDDAVLEPYEVTADRSVERSFVVPGELVATLGFAGPDG